MTEPSIPHCEFSAFLSADPHIVIRDGGESRPDEHTLHVALYETGAHLVLYAPTSALAALRDAIDRRLHAQTTSTVYVQEGEKR